MITAEDVKQVTPEKFWSKIKFGEPKECWDWTACTNNQGYGQIGVKKKFIKEGSKKAFVMALATRFMYEAVYGEFNSSLCVLHKCDRPICVNPNCFFLGTKKQNMQDMIAKGRAKHPPLLGSKNGSSKLTEEQVLLIKLRLLHGDTQKGLGRKFGVSGTMIRDIDRGHKWKHVVLQ